MSLETLFTILGSLLQLAFGFIFLFMAFKAFTNSKMLLIVKLLTKKNYLKGIPLKIYGLASLNIGFMFLAMVVNTAFNIWGYRILGLVEDLLLSVGIDRFTALIVYSISIVASIVLFLALPKIFGYIDEEAEKKEIAEDDVNENKEKNKDQTKQA